jgi:AcrR family transcriptional regulator
MSDIEQKSKSVPKTGQDTEDRRAARTQRMIKQALMELMHSMRYEDITVQHIIDRADVGRSTFYAHYSDKDEVAKQLLEEMMESITRGVKSGTEEKSAAFPIAEMFRHLQSQQLSAHGVWQSNRGRDYLFSVGQAYWNRRIERELKTRLGKHGVRFLHESQVVALVGGRGEIEHTRIAPCGTLGQIYGTLIDPGVQFSASVGPADRAPVLAVPDGQWVNPIVSQILAHHPGTHVVAPRIDFLDKDGFAGGSIYFLIEYQVPVAPLFFFAVEAAGDRIAPKGKPPGPLSSFVGGALIDIHVLGVREELTPPETFPGLLKMVGVIALRA